MKFSEEETAIVERFRAYLRIKSVQPSPDYDSCVAFLKQLAADLDIPLRIFSPRGKPCIILTIEGTDTSLPSVILNSHMDVVPVNLKGWTVPPFEAVMRENGDIVARGAQDMKSIGMAYLEAIRKLKNRCKDIISLTWTPRRTLHVAFLPDEEIGSVDGMKAFCETEDFRALNVGFALDEGAPSLNEAYVLFKGERSPLWIKIHATGNAGHGSLFIEDTAIDKILCFIEKVKAYAKEQKTKVTDLLELGKYTCMNVTMLNAGEQQNIVPGNATANIDIRLSPYESFDAMYKMLEDWASSAGVEIEYLQRPIGDKPNINATDDEARWVEKIDRVLVDEQHVYSIFSGATDSRFLRNLGIPAINFSPLVRTPILLHDHDEFLNAATYLNAIEIYEKLIEELVKD